MRGILLVERGESIAVVRHRASIVEIDPRSPANLSGPRGGTGKRLTVAVIVL